MTTKISIKPITNRQTWENLQSLCSPQVFVQAWEYADFLRSYGDQAFFLGVYSANELIGGSLIALVKAKRGNFYYLPYGPITIKEYQKAEVISQITQELKKRAQAEKVNFIRISPFWPENSENFALMKKSGYRRSPLHALAETTWILPLDRSPDELLKNMKQNHRNLIRRAERDGVIIKKTQDLSSLKNLHELLKITAARHKFTPFSYKYIETEFKAFLPDKTYIYEAYYNNTLLASATIFFHGDTAVYRHSASVNNPEYGKIPFNYAIQWEVINDAIQKGCKYYNFWGIAPEDAPANHPFKGLNNFKKGFGGEQIDLLPCHDYPLNFKYWGNWIIEKVRKWKRGF